MPIVIVRGQTFLAGSRPGPGMLGAYIPGGVAFPDGGPLRWMGSVPMSSSARRGGDDIATPFPFLAKRAERRSASLVDAAFKLLIFDIEFVEILFKLVHNVVDAAFKLLV